MKQLVFYTGIVPPGLFLDRVSPPAFLRQALCRCHRCHRCSHCPRRRALMHKNERFV